MILLSRRAFKEPILEALSQGALGCLNERAISTHLPKAVRQKEAGEAGVPRRMAARNIDRLSRRNIPGPEEDPPVFSNRLEAHIREIIKERK